MAKPAGLAGYVSSRPAEFGAAARAFKPALISLKTTNPSCAVGKRFGNRMVAAIAAKPRTVFSEG